MYSYGYFRLLQGVSEAHVWCGLIRSILESESSPPLIPENFIALGRVSCSHTGEGLLAGRWFWEGGSI